MDANKTILVTGATGAQGGGVARHLLAAGRFTVRAATRKPDSPTASALKEAGAEVVEADMDDVESLKRALAGCYGVFGVTNFWEHFAKERDHGMNLVAAVAASNVEHFVFSSLPSVKKFAPELNVPHFELKAEIEADARRRSLPLSAVHAAFYYENFIAFFPPQKQEDGTFAIGFPQGETPLAAVAVEDVGGVVARIFEDRETFLGKTIVVAGDELPAAEYAAIMSRELAKPIRYNHIPREVFAGFGFPGAEDLADMFEFYRSRIPSRKPDIEHARHLYPGLQAFAPWVRRHKEALLARLTA